MVTVRTAECSGNLAIESRAAWHSVNSVLGKLAVKGLTK